MENVSFNICERNEKGSKVRRNGQVPGVLSGVHLDNPIPVKMTRSDMCKLLGYSQSTILSLNLKGDVRKCVVRELQKDIYGKVIHVDFQCIRSDENIKMKVPVVFLGQEELGGNKLNLETFVSEVELFGEADKLPEKVEYDVSSLKFGDRILAKDLAIPEGLKLDGDKELIVAKVCGIAEEVEEEEE